MRLINTRTLELEEFFNKPQSKIPKYAILSHTWGEGEITFDDMQNGSAEDKPGYEKVRKTCEQAQRDGYAYAWVDTCAIDKTSSAELSEAINSMFKWYSKSAICYVYLADVSISNKKAWELPLDAHLTSNERHRFGESQLANSRWFKRGWTLQELIAPTKVTFYDRDWNSLGDIEALFAQVNMITSIDREAFASLKQRMERYLDPLIAPFDHLGHFSVAQKMSWAAKRETTREEDMAYCLLGIFDCHLPLLYGEGGRAFFRLQEEIIRVTFDHSILAWEVPVGRYGQIGFSQRDLLAPHPSFFEHARHIVRWPSHQNHEGYSLSNVGLSIKLPVIEDLTILGLYYGVLNCRYADDIRGPLSLSLQRIRPSLKVSTTTSNEPQSQPGSNPEVLSCYVIHHNARRLGVRRFTDLEYSRQPPRPVMIMKKDPIPSGLGANLWVKRGWIAKFSLTIQVSKEVGAKCKIHNSFPSSYWNTRSGVLIFPTGDLLNNSPWGIVSIEWDGGWMQLAFGCNHFFQDQFLESWLVILPELIPDMREFTPPTKENWEMQAVIVSGGYMFHAEISGVETMGEYIFQVICSIRTVTTIESTISREKSKMRIIWPPQNFGLIV